MEGKISARFSPKYDISLLKEVVARNPFGLKNSKETWLQIVENVNALLSETTNNAKFTERGCRDRVKLLVNAFKKETMASLKASGTDEEYSERLQLLTEVVELMEEKESIAREAEKSEHEKEKQGSDVRRVSMQKLSEKNADSNAVYSGVAPPVKKRRMINDYIDYLREKDEADRKLREQELQLKKEQLELEKKVEEQKIQRESLMMDLLHKMSEKLQ